jgi:hypothetical protein
MKMNNLKSLLEPLSTYEMPNRWSEIERRPIVQLKRVRNRSRPAALAVSLAAAALGLAVIIQMAPLTTRGPSDDQPKEPLAVPAWVVQEAQRMAAANGDPTPSSVQWMLTDANTAAAAVGLEEGDPDQRVYLLVLEGRFTATMSHPPAGEEFPEGSILAFTIDPSTQEVLDWNLSDTAVDLAGLQSLDPSNW